MEMRRESGSGIPAGKAPGSGREFRAPLPVDAAVNAELPGERRESRPWLLSAWGGGKKPGKLKKTIIKNFKFNPKKGFGAGELS